MDYRTLLLAPLAAIVLSVGAATPLRIPSGWLEHNTFIFSEATLSHSKGYEVGIDPASDAAGSPSLTVRFVASTKPWGVDMGAAHQVLSGYGGQRLRFSGQLRADTVKGWAGLFLGRGSWGGLNSIVTPRPGVEPLLPAGAAFAADGNWHDVSVVFDVPADAAQVVLGLALVGKGQVWARNLQFQVVSKEVPTTTTKIGVDLQSARRADAERKAEMAKEPPAPLLNAALD
ncbi:MULTISPECIES: hypothetical protein [unclassified Roseateles]|uniref:hypothetical protein n=1 Tax=unclassified Roseateles TaxID=2626991 RepID=UPI0006FAFD09|nr:MULTISPECIES: hypothetical protein [unclassified Roseateles]KQW52253.1 hypothetical protein ASC81_06635 [Pelomonas sp. Root405]KRA78487.1 hypothetical protein ASD88_06640 [Pelomonas sp. Root662]